MAGLTALVTASLLFKGENSIVAYAQWAQYTLALLVLLSLVLSVASLWLFLTAAYGRLEPRSAQSILDAGGVDVHNIHLAGTALSDLRRARRLSLFAAGLFAAALITSWFAPTARRPQSSVRLGVRGGSADSNEVQLCGELKGLDGNLAIIQVSGEPEIRRIKTAQLVSLNLVASCN